MRNFGSILLLLTVSSSQVLFGRNPEQVIELWPGPAPGEKGGIGPEGDTTQPKDNLVAGKQVSRIGNVSVPTISVYRPKRSKDTGASVLVCPGGGYHILAMDLEGTEVCDWLNSIGVTGILLKYRVPKRPGLEKHTAALQDAERSMGLIRSRAGSLRLDPTRVGVLGFSAGGHLAAVLSSTSGRRTYDRIDDADRINARPDFTILIYPAYLTMKDQGDKVAPEINLTSDTPPAFLVMAQNDPVRVETALYYAAALRKRLVPFELHVYPSGGHGYGLRPTAQAVTAWPEAATRWLRGLGQLKRK